jgi:hypothetical protein
MLVQKGKAEPTRGDPVMTMTSEAFGDVKEMAGQA